VLLGAECQYPKAGTTVAPPEQFAFAGQGATQCDAVGVNEYVVAGHVMQVSLLGWTSPRVQARTVRGLVSGGTCTSHFLSCFGPLRRQKGFASCLPAAGKQGGDVKW